MPDRALEAAAEAASATIAEDLALAVADDTSEQPEDAAAEAPAPQDAAPEAPTEPALTLEPDLPDEIRALVEEPDFDALAEEQPPAFDEPEDEQTYEYEDPETAALRKQLRVAEARAEWLEQKRVAAEREKWSEEAGKFFPLADPSEIQATSRRGFLRAAKEQHEKLLPRVLKHRADGDSIIADAKAQAERIVEEAKARAAEAWGEPTVKLTPQAPAPDRAELGRTIRDRGLAEGIKQMFQPPPEGGE